MGTSRVRCANTKGGTSIGEGSGDSCVKPPSHAIVYYLAHNASELLFGILILWFRLGINLQ
jgi:hypothetical protein